MKHFITYTVILFFLTGSLFAGIMDKIGLNAPAFKQLPPKIETAIDNIIDAAEINNKSIVSANNLKILSKFVIDKANGGSAWMPKLRRDANGAALINFYDIPIEKVIKTSLAANIPDAALFYNVLRYSKKIDLTPECKNFFVENSKRLNTNKIVETSYFSVESIAPNLQSGAYYSYTNRRTITRANIKGTEMLLSISDMVGPSTFSKRGAPVGNAEDGVFYYSEKLGLSMPGVTWAKSQMYISSTLTIYLQTPDGKTAVAMFSWQRAGWKGMNIIKSHHIYTVLQNTLSAFNNVFGNPKTNTESVGDIIKKVNNMSRAEKNNYYKEYCNYVKKWKDIKPKGLSPFRKSAIAKIFNEKSLNDMNQEYKDILIIQEFIRALIGKPTWSAMPLLIK